MLPCLFSITLIYTDRHIIYGGKINKFQSCYSVQFLPRNDQQLCGSALQLLDRALKSREEVVDSLTSSLGSQQFEYKLPSERLCALCESACCCDQKNNTAACR